MNNALNIQTIDIQETLNNTRITGNTAKRIVKKLANMNGLTSFDKVKLHSSNLGDSKTFQVYFGDDIPCGEEIKLYLGLKKSGFKNVSRNSNSIIFEI